MKTNGTHKLLLRLAWIVLLTLIFSFTHAQPDYDFRDGKLISGNDRQKGAIYRFSNVKPGVDATIEITDIGNGITVTDLDAGSGYPEALQPTLLVQPFTKGYLEMKLEFLYAGTNSSYDQAEVPATCIDVDGIINDGILPVNEFDELNLGSGAYVNYQMIGGELLVTQNSDWFIGRNVATIDYPGRDTSAKQAMFTVVNSNIHQGIIRVGVDNQSSKDATRLRSVYFKKFAFASALLPAYGLVSFTGVKQESKSVLNWELAINNSFSDVTVQRSSDGKNFTSIAYLTVQHDGVSNRQNYVDLCSEEGGQYYRLKFQGDNKVSYSSIVFLKNKSMAAKGFKIYPNLITSDANINLDVSKKQQGVLLISDYSGRIVKQQSLNLQEGNNTMQVSDLDRLAAGSYIAVIKLTDAVYNQKITIR